ncbi:MAG TPA: glycosyltransferase family 39 protein [Candidatus Dormibacteraeota bacterium]|nr:glycosyltransferase family 39 protein [Candidatus Dormibacteraeota bacterium]
MAAVGGAIAAFVSLSALYAHLTPFGQAPDEMAHLAYVRLIAEHLELPFDVREDQQPPAYYAAGALLYRLTGSHVSLQGFSIGLGALTLLMIWLTARELWPNEPLRQASPVALAAAIPQFQFMSSAVSNDPLSYLSGAWLVFLMVVVWRRPPDRRRLVAIGAAMGLGLLSKETDYVLVVVLSVVALVAWRRSLWRWDALLVPGAPALGAGWWFVRNLLAYHHPLPGLRPVGAVPLRLRHLSQARAWFDIAFRSSFAYFGNMTTPITIAGSQDLLYRALELALGLLGAVGLVELSRRWPSWPGRQRAVLATLVSVVVLAALQMVLNSVLVDYQAQGRYLYVALSAIVIGTACCLSAVGRYLPAGRLGVALRAVGLVVGIGAMAGVDVLGVITVHAHLISTPLGSAPPG